MRRVAFVALGLLLAGSTLAGCSGILPRESAFTRQPWDDFAAAQAAFGNSAAATRALDQAKIGKPDISISAVRDIFNATHAHPEVLKSILTDLRKAGLAEE